MFRDKITGRFIAKHDYDLQQKPSKKKAIKEPSHKILHFDTGPIERDSEGRYAIICKVKMKGILKRKELYNDEHSYHVIIQNSKRITKKSKDMIKENDMKRYNQCGIQIIPVATIDRWTGKRVNYNS